MTLDTVKEVVDYYNDLPSKIEYGKSLAKQFNINVKQIDGYKCLMSSNDICFMKAGIILADGQWQLLTKNKTRDSYIDIEIPNRITQQVKIMTLSKVANNCDVYYFSDEEINNPNSHVVMVVGSMLPIRPGYLVIDPKNNKLGLCLDIHYYDFKLIDFISDGYNDNCASRLMYIIWRDCPPEIMKKVTSKVQKKFNK